MKTGEINYLDVVKNYHASVGLTPSQYTYEVRQGRGRYNKVVASALEGQSLFAVAFIDRTTGAMYRAASWSKPAKTRIV